MFSQWSEIKRGDAFAVGCDTSMGAGDWCVAQFIRRPKTTVEIPDVPVVYASKDSAPVMTDALVPYLEKLFDLTGVKPVVAYERNNGGAFEMDRLAKLNRLHKYIIFVMPDPTRRSAGDGEEPEGTRLGWDTNSASRPAMLADLKELVDGRRIEIYDPATVSELFSFITVTTNTSRRAEAERNAHDDRVMSLAIAWQVHKLSAMPQTDVRRAQLAMMQERALAGML